MVLAVARTRRSAADGLRPGPKGPSPTALARSVQSRPPVNLMAAGDVLHLQRTAGNLAVQRALGGRPTLRIGSQGAGVRDLQTILRGGGAAITADGMFGPKTKAAVVAFQRSAGLGADGVVGPKTWGALDARGAGGAAGPVGASATTGAPELAAVHGRLATIRELVQQLNTAAPIAGPSGSADFEPLGARDVPSGPVGHDGDESSDDEGSWFDDLVDGAQGVVNDVVDGVQAGANEAIDTVQDVVGDAVDAVQDAIGPGVVSDTIESVQGAVGGTVDAAQGVVNTAVDTGQGVVNTVVDTGQSIAGGTPPAEAVGQMLEGIKGDLQSARDEVKQAVAPVLAILGDLKDAAVETLGAILAKLDRVIQGLQSLLPDAPDTPGAADQGFAGPCGPFEARGGIAVADAAIANVSLSSDTKESTNLAGIAPSDNGLARAFVEPSGSYVKTPASKLIAVRGNLHLTAKYQVRRSDQGRVPLSGAQDPAITAENWDRIVEALTPNSTGRPTTTMWFVPHITEAHEKFHCAEFLAAAPKVMPEVHRWMLTQPVGPLTTAAHCKSEADALLDGAGRALLRLITKEVGGGTTEVEDRAYGATAAGYHTLVAEIRARAKKEKWKPNVRRP